MVFTKVKTPDERFHSKYTISQSGCWEWQGANNSNGYGVFWDYGLGRNDGAHRASYRLHVGEIPPGWEVDHICQNPGCVNPDHLEAVTPAENKRRVASRRTHCPSNHPWDEENTRWYRGHRRCRGCDRIAKRKKTATEQYDLGLWDPEDSSPNELDNVRAGVEADSTNNDGSVSE